MPRVLIIDSNVQRAQATAQLLRSRMGEGAGKRVLTSRGDIENALEQAEPADCYLIEHPLDGISAFDVMERILENDPFAAIIMTSVGGKEQCAIRALKRGAMDFYVRSNFTGAGLERAVRHAVDRALLKRRIEDQQDSLRSFTYMLVHDLRAPLRSVRGGIAMLEEDLPSDVARQNADTMHFIRAGAERMDRLILGLYRLCQVDSARLQTAPVGLDNIVADLRATLSADLAARHGLIVARGPLPEVHADRMQLSLLLQNLAANALKFNRSQAPRVEISCTETAAGWRIEVADNGIGIAQEDMVRIFEPFQRLHPSEAFEGTGLGLATCMRVARRHGARLNCRSALGEGTVFTLELPRKAVEGGRAGSAGPGATTARAS